MHGGAMGKPTNVANMATSTYSWNASYDRDGRQTGSALLRFTTGATLWSEARGYDAVGNVATESMTLPDGTDNARYCYDAFNRLTWAGNNGTSPCAGAVSGGSLGTAYYQQSFAYDTLDRLTSGPAGSYTYSSGHLHGVSSINSTYYQAKYDLSGAMTCRTIISTQNCGTTPTGQSMSYDNAGRLTHWQDLPSAPSHQQDMAYDGEGNRVAFKLDGTITYYLGQYAEITGSTHTKYLQAGSGLPAVMSTGSGMGRALKYLMADGLGSITAIFDDQAHVQSQMLYAPYGGLCVYLAIGLAVSGSAISDASSATAPCVNGGRSSSTRWVAPTAM